MAEIDIEEMVTEISNNPRIVSLCEPNLSSHSTIRKTETSRVITAIAVLKEALNNYDEKYKTGN